MTIEDYGFIGNTQTGALVGRDGGVDWLFLPRYDSGSCLAALVGDERHGRRRLAPAAGAGRCRQREHPALKQSGWDDVAFLSGRMMTYHGFHRTPLEVGKGGMTFVAHAEDELAQRAGALEHV